MRNLFLMGLAFSLLAFHAVGGEAEPVFKKRFDLKLQYRNGQEKLFPAKKVLGSRYLGSGTGTIVGDGLTGNVKWDLYEVQNEDHCLSDFFGAITTTDGKTVSFHARGAFTVEGSSGLWQNVSSIRFEPRSEGFNFLKERNFILKGAFDMSSGTHTYEVYQQQESGAHR